MPVHDDSKIEISNLVVYPIKGCAGIELETISFDEHGIKYDRNWGIADQSGKILTQRDNSKLALLKTELTNSLRLSAPEMTPIELPIATESKDCLEVTVWGQKCSSIAEGKEVSDWLSHYLDTKVSLVKVSKNNSRPVDNEDSETSNTKIAFQDGFPVLLISESSLDNLNTKLEKDIKMNRFRPNIVIRGCGAYEEDNWRQIKIGSQQLNFVKLCARCVVTTIDQETGSKGSEPLKTLSRERRVGNRILFGNYAIHLNLENISVGDRLKVLL